MFGRPTSDRARAWPRRGAAGASAAIVALAVAACQVPRPEPPAIAPARGDLLHEARGWRERAGLAAARNHLAGRLAALDASGGELERRVARTNREPGWVFPDSWAALPRGQRARTGVYLVLGFRQNTGEAAEVLNHVAAGMRADGWRARVVPLNQWGSARDHAQSIERFLRGELPRVDRAVMVGFSMGAASWVRWMADHSAGWPAGERRKLRVAVFFGASLRGAAAARWLAAAKGIEAGLMRAQLSRLDGGRGEALAAVGHAAGDLWAGERIPPLCTMLPGLQVVEYVTLPDGDDGLPRRDRLLRGLARPVARQMPWIGPCDGMVEAGAQVLPPGDRTPQWIVRVCASHGITEGFYLAGGGDVSPRHGRVAGQRPQAGRDMVDDLLRALPRSLLE